MAVETQERLQLHQEIPVCVAPALLALPEFSRRELTEIKLRTFLTEKKLAPPPPLTDDMSWFDMGWRRHSIYPDILVPSGFLSGSYLVIHCQITGETLKNPLPHYKMINPETKETLFVGSRGCEFLSAKGWRNSVQKEELKSTKPKLREPVLQIFDSRNFNRT